MPNTPHLDKLDAAYRNAKCEDADVRLIEEAKERYRAWKAAEQALTATGKPRVIEMTRLLALNEAPVVAVKVKDQDFIIGKEIHYRFSPDPAFAADKTTTGSLSLAVLAAETKVNLDKTMFQEAAGTASRLKQGCPYSQYYILNEYLDMEPEDCRLTAIDNVFLLRHAKRLPFERRSVLAEVRRQHENFPIDSEIVWTFTQKIQAFINAAWYDPAAALQRGSFV